jgi:hypothetical protein
MLPAMHLAPIDDLADVEPVPEQASEPTPNRIPPLTRPSIGPFSMSKQTGVIARLAVL